ncbi:MAG: hypothetical protein ACJA1C_003341 [Crocinitomicaceae bacterium]|jgi:hypothetical protein
MKKSNALKFFAFALLALVVTSCSKYEEGSKFTLLTKTQRLVNTWTMTKTTVTDNSNGNTVDITSQMPDITVNIKKDGTYTYTQTVGSFSNIDNGTWVFSSDKLTVILTDSNGDTETATIIKLKNKELKMSTTDGDDTTVMEYTGL